MRPRFVLLTILASSALQATSFTSASCALGTTTETVTGPTSSSCSIPVFVDGINTGFVEAEANVSGSPATALNLEAGGGITSSPFPNNGFSGSGDATYLQTFATAGPRRPGFLSVFTNGFGGAWDANITQNGSVYRGGPLMFPFELGETFQVFATANGGGGGSPGCNPFCSGVAGDSSAQMSGLLLFEADGSTGVPYFAIVTPEPASRGSLLFGLTACAMFYLRTRKTALNSLDA